MNELLNPELVFFFKFVFLWALAAAPVLLIGNWIQKKLKVRKEKILAKQRSRLFY